MHKKTGIVFVGIGVVLMLSALLLFFHNEAVEKNAEEASQTVMEKLRQKIPPICETTEFPAETEAMPDLPAGDDVFDAEASEEASAAPDAEAEPEEALTEPDTGKNQTILIDGYDYIGFLTIPDLELELPVIADWDMKKLETAPCRHFGSAAAGDLVIAGHNYRKHFGRLDRLKIGGTVRFTEISGKTYEYVIREMRTLEATDVDIVQESERELILYTCTYTGKTRLMIGCEEVKADGR